METIDQIMKINEFVALKEYTKGCECGYGYMVKEICSHGDKFYCIGCDKSYFEERKILKQRKISEIVPPPLPSPKKTQQQIDAERTRAKYGYSSTPFPRRNKTPPPLKL